MKKEKYELDIDLFSQDIYIEKQDGDAKTIITMEGEKGILLGLIFSESNFEKFKRLLMKNENL